MFMILNLLMHLMIMRKLHLLSSIGVMGSYLEKMNYKCLIVLCVNCLCEAHR